MTSHRSLFWRSGIRFQRCTNNSASVRFCLSPAVASHRITLLRLQQGLTIPQDFLLKYPSSFHTSRTRRTLCTSLCDYSHKVWTLSGPKLCSFYFSIKKCRLFNVLKCLYNVSWGALLDLCSALTSVSSKDHKTEVFSCFLMIAECKISSRGDQKLLLLEGGVRVNTLRMMNLHKHWLLV